MRRERDRRRRRQETEGSRLVSLNVRLLFKPGEDAASVGGGGVDGNQRHPSLVNVWLKANTAARLPMLETKAIAANPTARRLFLDRSRQ